MDPRTPLDNTAIYAEWFIAVSPQKLQPDLNAQDSSINSANEFDFSIVFLY
jgi:hypothetical protein